MTSPNEKDRLAVRSALKEWGNPQTAMALIMMGYPRDLVQEEFVALIELINRVNDSLGAPTEAGQLVGSARG